MNILKNLFKRRVKIHFRDVKIGQSFYVGKKKLYKARRVTNRGRPFNCFELNHKDETKTYHFCSASDIVEIIQTKKEKK